MFIKARSFISINNDEIKEMIMIILTLFLIIDKLLLSVLFLYCVHS